MNSAVPEAVPLGERGKWGRSVIKLHLPAALEQGCRSCSPGLLVRRENEPAASLAVWALWLPHPGSEVGGWTCIPRSHPGREWSHGQVEHMASEVSWSPEKDVI